LWSVWAKYRARFALEAAGGKLENLVRVASSR